MIHYLFLFFFLVILLRRETVCCCKMLPACAHKHKQQIDNIATCLRLLTALGIPLDDVTANDIHQGNLKSILTVFFALSRYKQQQKLQIQQQQQQQEMAK